MVIGDLMSIFKNNIVTASDVKHCNFEVEENINGLMTKTAILFYALGVKPTAASPVLLGSLLNGEPKIMADTFPSGVRFLLTESEAKTFATGVMSYIACYANSIEEALLLINERNKKRILEDKHAFSCATGRAIESIKDEMIADKITKHYLNNYLNLSYEGDSAISIQPFAPLE